MCSTTYLYVYASLCGLRHQTCIRIMQATNAARSASSSSIKYTHSFPCTSYYISYIYKYMFSWLKQVFPSSSPFSSLPVLRAARAWRRAACRLEEQNDSEAPATIRLIAKPIPLATYLYVYCVCEWCIVCCTSRTLSHIILCLFLCIISLYIFLLAHI